MEKILVACGYISLIVVYPRLYRLLSKFVTWLVESL